MTITMSMRERREKIDELVQHDPRVIACAHRFEAAQADITDWHARNDALCATKGALTELEELITYSEAALDDLKRAKTTAYNQLMSQYPHVWDTTCADPFDTDTQDDTAHAVGETEEMPTVPEPDGHAATCAATLHITTYNPSLRDWIKGLDREATHAARAAQHNMPVDASQYIPVAVVKSILTKKETEYKELRDFCASHGLDPNGACCAVFVIKRIRDDIDKLTTTTEENHNA